MAKDGASKLPGWFRRLLPTPTLVPSITRASKVQRAREQNTVRQAPIRNLIPTHCRTFMERDRWRIRYRWLRGGARSGRQCSPSRAKHALQGARRHELRHPQGMHGLLEEPLRWRSQVPSGVVDSFGSAKGYHYLLSDTERLAMASPEHEASPWVRLLRTIESAKLGDFSRVAELEELLRVRDTNIAPTTLLVLGDIGFHSHLQVLCVSCSPARMA